jgi:hypothetical protein
MLYVENLLNTSRAFHCVDEEATAICSAEGWSSGQLLGKRSLPAPFARTTRPRMDVDQLSSDVQNLGVNSH